MGLQTRMCNQVVYVYCRKIQQQSHSLHVLSLYDYNLDISSVEHRHMCQISHFIAFFIKLISIPTTFNILDQANISALESDNITMCYKLCR